MDFRRNGVRDERRRRVLIDETLHGGDPPDASTASSTADGPESGKAPAKSYSDAAVASSQTPVTYFLPKHPIITWGVWLIGLALIAGIEVLYHFVHEGATGELRESLIALDVTARGSLASWFAALVLGVSAFSSLIIYQIRRHRTDDYRGRYRWWLWLAPLLLALSATASTELHEAVSGVLTLTTGAEIAMGGKGWWLLAYAAVFFPIVLQLAIELWPSRMATFFFAMTTVAYVIVALLELGALHVSPAWAAALCHSALLLFAHLGVLVTILGYGRYVYLDAHGRLASRRAWVHWPKTQRTKNKKLKSKSTESTEKPARAAKQVRVDDAHAKFGQEKTAPPTVILTPRINDDDEDDEPDDATPKLSKSERRRLRKESQRLQRG